MNVRLAFAVGVALVIGIVGLWPRRTAQHETAPPELETVMPVLPHSDELSDPETTLGDGKFSSSSVHARALAAAKSASNSPGVLRESNEEILARLRSGWRPPTLEELSGPPGPPVVYDDPAIMRNVGVWPESPEERIARLRAGELPPMLDYVQGPPGKPRLREGTPRSEVLAAWGTPVHVYPAHTDMRGEQNEALMAVAHLAPFETDRIEYLETWQYTPLDDPHPKQWRFDGDLLTARAVSVKSQLALEIEQELQRILHRDILDREQPRDD